MATSSPPATHLVFVRHGQSLSNRDGAEAGADAGLTALGWLQSHAVAAWLGRALQANAVISSTMVRARQTAEIIGQRLHLPVELQPGLEEADQPYWNEFPQAQPAAPLALWDAAWHPTAESAPTYTAFRARLRQAMDAILQAHADQTVVIVSHGGAIATIIRSLFGGHQVPIFTENTGITHLAWQEGRWRLIAHNAQAHLEAVTPRTPTSRIGDAGTPAEALSPYPWAGDAHMQAIVSHYDRVAGAPPVEPPILSAKELRALVNLVSPRPGARVLEAGAGTGAIALAFAPHAAEVIGVDISPAMLERAEQARVARKATNVYFRWADAADLPFSDGSFDLVVSRNLLNYVSEPAALLTGFGRVLRPNGRLLMDEIIGSDDPVKRATHETIEIRRNPAFIKVHSKAEIENLLVRAGFRVEKAETPENTRELTEWLERAAADEATRVAVRTMIEASAGTNAAGLRSKLGRDGTITFIQRRLRLAAVKGS
ncbi:MAG: methyltransferase domain-containing protein [Chloroflexi bacterium]|nr:methyltransferase domain-containing protein [Chloroflexota bacterium]